ncbi:MAG: HK97 family phage prohead protease [Pseudomonadota bacterium]
MAHCCNAAGALASLAEVGRFEGYASVFGRIDQGRDEIMPGAFARSLKARGAGGVKLLWQHDPREPVGVIEHIREDSHGLFVRGRLLGDVIRAREAQALLRAGALDGLSIGYKVRAAEVDAARSVRRLIDIDLWEVSLVTFPMQPAARLTAIKARPAPDAPPDRYAKPTSSALLASLQNLIHALNTGARP